MDSLHNMGLKAYHRIDRFFGIYDASIFSYVSPNKMIYLFCMRAINLRMLPERFTLLTCRWSWFLLFLRQNRLLLTNDSENF